MYDNINAILCKCMVDGMSPESRSALSIMTDEMIQDSNQLEIYQAVKSIDNFGSQVSMNTVYDVVKKKIDFGDIINLCKNTVKAADPIWSAMQVASMHNDAIAKIELSNIVGMLSTGKPFDRNEVSSKLADLSQSLAPKSKKEPLSFHALAENYVNVLESRQNNEGSAYLDIGLDVDIDSTALVVLGGQPGMGKTALALYVNNYIARQGKTALIFSLEMDGGQLFERQVSSMSKIPTQKLKRIDYNENELSQTEWGLISKSLNDLSDMKVFIDDDASLTVPILISKVKAFKEKHPDLALITIDYLTLMKMPEASRRDLSVGEATRQMKILAKEIKTPVLLLSQLNREADKAAREPRNSDLRDSGSIEQDADVIIFPYREEVHHEDSPNKGLAKIIKSKVRDGETGASVLGFSQGCFHEIDACWKDPEPEEKQERRKF